MLLREGIKKLFNQLKNLNNTLRIDHECDHDTANSKSSMEMLVLHFCGTVFPFSTMRALNFEFQTDSTIVIEVEFKFSLCHNEAPPNLLLSAKFLNNMVHQFLKLALVKYLLSYI